MDTVLVSLDGVRFSAAPTGSLFAEHVVLMPEARTSATVWARNAAAEPAAVTGPGLTPVVAPRSLLAAAFAVLLLLLLLLLRRKKREP